MPTTVLQLFSDALADVGGCDPGQTPSPSRIQFARRKHTGMMRSWSTKRLRLFYIPESAYTLQGGKGTYLIGPLAADFDTSTIVPPAAAPAYVKPVFIQAGSVIVGTGRRWPLNILTRPQWDLNNTKTLTDPDGPLDLFYDFGSPMGTINIAPKPTGAQQMLLSQWNPLPTFNEGDEQLNIEDFYPQEYIKPMQLGLAIELAPAYRFQVTQDMAALFGDSIGQVERMNNDKLSGAYGTSRTLDGPVKGDGSPVAAPPQQ